ncbi:MAG: glycosyltransferase family 2 protein [Planctomycetaceae bacterium]|nr:glycosyltransferase family 2 protein [Planctomycetaceae bacterium]
MNYLTLASMVRNEEHYVQEWLTLHYVQGFEQFVIVLHKCDDKTEERIRALPFADKIHIHKVVSDTQRAQMSAFVWIAEHYGYTTEWLLFCDSDEYICGTESDDFREVLANYEDFGGLFLNWSEYGHNGERERPPGLCIENYVRRQPHDWAFMGKSLVKPRELLRPYAPASCNDKLGYSFLSPHMFKTAKPTVHTDYTPISYRYFWHVEHKCHEIARCNHYLFRSWEDWQIKHHRGNCNDDASLDKGLQDCYALAKWEHGGNHSVLDTSVVRFAGKVREVLGR